MSHTKESESIYEPQKKKKPDNWSFIHQLNIRRDCRKCYLSAYLVGEKDREIYKPTKLYRIFQNAQKAAWKHRKDTSLQHRWKSSLTQDKKSLTWYATGKKIFIQSMKKNDNSMHAPQEEWQFNRAPCKKNRPIHEDAPYAKKSCWSMPKNMTPCARHGKKGCWSIKKDVKRMVFSSKRCCSQ